MKSRLTLVVLALVALADPWPALANTDRKIEELTQQIDEMKKQVEDLKKETEKTDHQTNVLADAVGGAAGVGTLVRARRERLPARKLWIAFALPSEGTITVDAGARAALLGAGGSLLAVGVTDAAGGFASGDAVEVAGPDGEVFAKGLVAHPVDEVRGSIGERAVEVIHRDDFVVLPEAVRSG